MSDLEIRSGGAIAVDTDLLRAAAGRLRDLGIRVGELAARARLVAGDAASAPSVGYEVAIEARWLGAAADRIADEPGTLAGALEGLAAAYEVIELRIEREVLAASGDTDAVRVIDLRLTVLEESFPHAARMADSAVAQWRGGGPAEMARQVAAATWWIPGALVPLVVGTGLLWHSVGSVGLGRMSGPPGAATSTRPAATGAGPGAAPVGAAQGRGARQPRPDGAMPSASAPASAGAPQVRATTPAQASAPVAGLADAAGRVPGEGDSRIRIERYALPGGQAEYAVYVAGTQTWAGGGGDPFDMRSNLELYGGDRSASLGSAEQALREAGVGPGDPVHLFGHSQGAMIASALALDTGFDVRTLVTFGSPVEAAVGPEVLSVGIRHPDDPVAGLAGGGHAQQVGAPGSFIAERVADPAGGVQDAALAAHGIDVYADTAALVDASADPRAVQLRDLWARLGQATSVETVEYSAERGG